MTAPLLSLIPSSALEELPADPSQWTYQQAEDIVRRATPTWIQVTSKFISGDHWQSGAAWIGPQLPAGVPGQSETLALLSAGFTARNVVKEISERHTNGLVGFEPSWELTPKRVLEDDEEPTPEETALMDEAHAALTDWWDRRGMTVRFWDAAYQLAWASRSDIRLYLTQRAFRTIAADKTTRTVVEQQSDLAAALRLILVDVPSPEAAAVYTNPDTQEDVGVRLIQRGQQKLAELTWLTENGQTAIRTINGTTPDAAFDLAGHLVMFELRRPRLITDQALQLQRALNLALSIVPRTLITAGFLERVLINANLDGEFVTRSDGTKYFKPYPITFGPGTTLTLDGEKYTDPQTGRTGRDTPDVLWRPPVPVTGSLEARTALYEAMLEECAQAHVILNSEATPSGRSREQARADFKASLGLSKHAVDRAGRWLIGAALSLAESLMQAPGKYTDTLRVRFNSRLDTGPLDIAERAQNVAEWKENLLSRESVLIRGGVEDPDAEMATVSSEPGAQLAMSLRQAEVFAAWTENSAGPQLAAEFAGLEDEDAKQIAKDLAAGEREAIEAAEEQQPTPQEP